MPQNSPSYSLNIYLLCSVVKTGSPSQRYAATQTQQIDRRRGPSETETVFRQQ